MPVVGRNLNQPFVAHRLHRNAIDQAVPFVGTGPVQFQACKEGFPALRNNQNGEALDRIGDVSASLGPDAGPRAGKKCQILTKHFIGRDYFVGREGTAEIHGAFMSGILGTRQGGPIKRIGENNPHTSRFGTP